MATGIIDNLELIKVDIQECMLLSQACRIEHVMQFFLKAEAVNKSRQCIMIRHVVNLLFGLAVCLAIDRFP